MPHPSISDMRVSELVELIGSDRISPGAGAAGGLALALSAACAAKAVSISLKHSPDDAALAAALSGLEQVRNFALLGADADSRAFADFVKHKSSTGAAGLVATGDAIAYLIDALFRIIKDVKPRVRPTMTGDLLAAESLASAARTIQSANEAEAKDEQGAISKQESTRQQ